jgi:peptide/nickel transport system substrate-binding protein
MKKTRLLYLIGALLAASLLVTAACAPADEDDADTDTDTTTTAPSDASQPTGAVGPSDDTMTDKDDMTMSPGESVSGVPLDPDAVRGGVLTIATTAWGPTFSNWEEAAGSAPQMGHPLANMLIAKQDWGTKDDRIGGAHWNLIPDLGVSWEQSADGLQWTFNLREGVVFSDGEPFTCDDVKWSYDTIRTGEGLNRSPRAVHMLAIEEITCADDLTAVFTLSRPKSSFLEVIGLPYHVIWPEHKYAGNTDEMRESANVGTGPYVVAEVFEGDKMTFERKADYWDRPLPYLDGIEVSILGNNPQVAALRAGRLDIGGGGGNWNGARADTLIKECDRCQLWNTAVHPGMMFSVIPNFSRTPWNTQEVRDAISLAIDRQKMIDLGYDGWMTPGTQGMFLPGLGFGMPEDVVKTIPGHDFSDPEANKERARQLLAEAGFGPGELKASINIAPFYAPYIVPAVEDLQAIGIDAEPNQQETALYYTDMSNGNFDLAGHAGYIGGFDPDFILYEYFYTGSDRNYGRYSNIEVDRLIDEQSVTLDPEARREKAWEVAEIIMREQVRTLGGFQRAIPIFSDEVMGFLPSVPSQSYGNTYRHSHTWVDRG